MASVDPSRVEVSAARSLIDVTWGPSYPIIANGLLIY